MKRLELTGGVIATLLAVTWPTFAVWASAQQLISRSTESLTSLIAVGVAALGPLLCWDQSRSQRLLSFVLTVVASVLALTATVTLRSHSDQMFAHWMTERLRGAPWQSIEVSVNKIASQGEGQGQTSISPTDLPNNLRRLGHADGPPWANVLNLQNGIHGVELVYGTRNRRWGLAVGSPEFLDYYFGDTYSPRSRYKRVQIATNSVFFVGSD